MHLLITMPDCWQIKPENIFLFNNSPRIADFETAKDATALPATTMQDVGTVGYVAPEVMTGEGPSSASDIYSLGVIIHEAYCKEQPKPWFSVTSDDSKIIGVVPPRIRPWLEKMLQNDPKHRPTADQLLSSRAFSLTPTVSNPSQLGQD